MVRHTRTRVDKADPATKVPYLSAGYLYIGSVPCPSDSEVAPAERSLSWWPAAGEGTTVTHVVTSSTDLVHHSIFPSRHPAIASPSSSLPLPPPIRTCPLIAHCPGPCPGCATRRHCRSWHRTRPQLHCMAAIVLPRLPQHVSPTIGAQTSTVIRPCLLHVFTLFPSRSYASSARLVEPSSYITATGSLDLYQVPCGNAGLDPSPHAAAARSLVRADHGVLSGCGRSSRPSAIRCGTGQAPPSWGTRPLPAGWSAQIAGCFGPCHHISQVPEAWHNKCH